MLLLIEYIHNDLAPRHAGVVSPHKGAPPIGILTDLSCIAPHGGDEKAAVRLMLEKLNLSKSAPSC